MHTGRVEYVEPLCGHAKRNGTPSVDEDTDEIEGQLRECKQYTVEELFCCAYAPFFWQAIQLRYPEYASYDRKLYDLIGGSD